MKTSVVLLIGAAAMLLSWSVGLAGLIGQADVTLEGGVLATLACLIVIVLRLAWPEIAKLLGRPDKRVEELQGKLDSIEAQRLKDMETEIKGLREDFHEHERHCERGNTTD